MHRTCFRTDDDFGCAAHHDPMLGAMEMLLQRKRGVWIHDNALDLVARADINSLIIAPRAVNSQMLIGPRPVLRLELFDYRLDLFRCIAREATNTASDVATTTMLSRPTTAVTMLSSERARLLRLFRKTTGPTPTLPSRSCGSTSQTEFQLPTVGPAEIDGNDRSPRGTLHYRIVDRFLWRASERLGR